MALARKSQYDAYKDTEIQTANQGKLIVMLYDGAIRFLRIAQDNLNPRTYDVANTNIIKAQDIITELMLSLNMEGGEVAQNLFNLYAYMKKRLLEANMAKDSAVIDEVIKLIEPLKSAWEEVLNREGTGASAPRPTSGRPEGAGLNIQG
ncbi:MAG TPA: flagellar export chaperone FliS [Leptospiraceae bacterium]|nr:flagellar export chaperone FliS [Spirochaetaceae bacterium]HBS05778.1 flagellar export chaperone FliS [Leptospiraceae bacterium]|tara:strand:- start:33266 stop:33712 length:447 start_codon:yes stop_codon:yes gene_type:complete